MAIKKQTPPAPAPAPAADSKGNRRVYVDLPAPLITRMNVLAAMRSVTKRALIASLLTDAINRASSEAKL